MLWKFFYAGLLIRAVQIRAMRKRASRGMTVYDLFLLEQRANWNQKVYENMICS